MVRLIKIILVLGLVIGAAFLYLSITGGGAKFRKFGREVQKESVEIAVAADRIKKTADKVKDRAEDTIRRSELIANTINSDRE